MKKYVAMFLISICTIFMIGCSNSIEIMSVGNSTSNTWTSEYLKFSGDKLRSINLKKGEVVKLDVVSEKGDLEITIKDEKGETCFNEEIIETSTFEFIPESDGKYEVKIEAKNHKGSFDISWGEDGSK